MESVTFRSAITKLMISFSPETFGMGKNAEGKDAPYPPIHFDYGMYRTDNAKLIEMLRKHSENTKNNGEQFWEEDRAVTARVNLKQGEVTVVYTEKELSDDDKADIEYLTKAAEKCLPTQVNNIIDKLGKLQDKFAILGLVKPTPSMDIKRIKARIIEYIGALEDAGVIKNDRTGDIG